jgi:hypothetical protein
MEESVRYCMTFEERPPTPDDIKKYRRSANLAPGKRYVHPKLNAEDIQRFENMTFGMTSKSSECTTAALIGQNGKSTVVSVLNAQKAESIYNSSKREPLGQTYSRHYNLPEKFQNGIVTTFKK